MKRIMWFLSTILLIVVISCSSVRVHVNYDESADFLDYHSFFFVKSKPSAQVRRGRSQPLVFSKSILNEIQNTLESKGFAKASVKEKADLLVIFYTQIHNRTNVVQPTYRVGRWGGVWRTRPGRVVRYKEGTLVIDIVDREKQELIWQGVGNGVLDRVNPTRNLAEAAAEILKKFPPEA
ncbi:DUF4136 domain-containing protein [bacterium]